MALKFYLNEETKETKRALSHPGDGWSVILQAPQIAKFTESVNSHKGKHRVKGLTQDLTARSRNHSRDIGLDHSIHITRVNGMGVEGDKQFLNSKGERRTKLDDI